MTKEQLNKLINASVQYNAYTGTWSIDIDSIYKQYCDDLNAFVKKFVDFQPIIEHYEQRVEQAKKEVAREIINKFDNKLTEKCLKSAEEQQYQQTARILKDVCPVKSHRVAKELAKEYEVEL